ncbi:MAG TPA: non-homologous end-joining DNA ligase [Acidimicrobiales bacterium]
MAKPAITAWPPALRPMRAVTGMMPTDDGWSFEIKWDGMRALAFLGDGFRLRSSNDIELRDRFGELHGLPDQLAGHHVVLDGEIVALGADGVSDFGRLQHRMHVADPAEAVRRQAVVPVTYQIFDLLYLDGVATLDLPYQDRRRLLGELVEPGPSWQVPRHLTGDGPALLEAATAQGLEGLMAKRLASRYEPGRRAATWRKIKIRRQQEVVVGGWTRGTGAREASLGALLVGVHDPDAPGRPLRFAGAVGTGFTDETLALLGDRLAELRTDDCPFTPDPPRTASRDATWVQPRLVAEVQFGEWTEAGRLRHPTFLGLRFDVAPEQVVREPVTPS